jgi:hypothetical protein
MLNSIKEEYFKISSLKIYYKRVGNSKKKLFTLHGGPNGASVH